jgi:hypothetical protein
VLCRTDFNGICRTSIGPYLLVRLEGQAGNGRERSDLHQSRLGDVIVSESRMFGLYEDSLVTKVRMYAIKDERRK